MQHFLTLSKFGLTKMDKTRSMLTLFLKQLENKQCAGKCFSDLTKEGLQPKNGTWKMKKPGENHKQGWQ